MTYNSEKVAQIARQILDDINIDPRDAARRAGMHRATVYSILAGDKVSRETLVKFGNISGDPEPLLIAAGYEEVTDTLEQIEIALRKNKDLSEAAKKEIVGIIKSVMERERQISSE